MAQFIHLRSCILGLAALSALGVPLHTVQASELARGFVRPTSISLEQVFEQLDRDASTQLLPKQPHTQSFVLTTRGQYSHEYSVGMNGMGQSAFTPNVTSPYFSLLTGAAHAGISREWGGLRIRYSILRSGLNHSSARRAFDEDALSPALMTIQPRIDARVLELTHSFDQGALSFSLMRSKEQLPEVSSQRSVTAFGFGAPTKSVQLTGVWLVAPKIALAAQASYGRTSLAMGGGTVRSNAFSIGVVASDRYRIGDRFSITLSQPILPYRGQIVGANGVLLNPAGFTAREVLAEMNYVTPFGPSAYGGWAVSLRRHPDNISSAPLEKMLALRYVRQF